MTLRKHINNTDVAAWWVKSYYIPATDIWKIKVRWFNINNPKNVFDLNCVETVKIRNCDRKNWEIYELE